MLTTCQHVTRANLPIFYFTVMPGSTYNETISHSPESNLSSRKIFVLQLSGVLQRQTKIQSTKDFDYEVIIIFCG